MKLNVASLEAITERINTGLDDPETSRALVVFNQTDQPLSGAAVFHADMSWPLDMVLPAITVTADGKEIASAISCLTNGPDAKGRADRRQLTFSLCFAVTDVPANGWRTYIAMYTDTAAAVLEDFIETPGLVVVETTRHDGDLPSAGILS